MLGKIDPRSPKSCTTLFEKLLERRSTSFMKTPMNPPVTQSLRLAAALALASAASALAQTTATTDPVGFITLNIAGTGGTSSTAISFKGLGLTRPVEYQGAAEAVTANTVTDDQATWTDNQFNGANGAFYLEISSGPGAGTTYDITATSAANKRITLAQNLATGITASPASPVSFKIRRHWTIASVFGANNEGGLGAGQDASTADVIQLWNGVGYDGFYYQSGAAIGGVGWRSPSDVFANAGGRVIYPDDGLVIRRKQSGAAAVVLMGAVKTGQTSFPIQPGTNIVANACAAPVTLGSSGLQASGLAAGGDASAADLVLIWNGQGYEGYYYQSGSPIGGVGWRSGSDVFADASGTQIPVGAAVIIKRRLPNGFDWKLPQHPANL